MKVNVIDVHGGDRIMLLLRWIFGAIGMPIYFIGLKYIPTSFGAIIVNISPIIVAILAFMFLKEKLTKIKVLTVLGAFFGVAIIVFGKESKSSEYGDLLFGIICSLTWWVMFSIVI